MTMLKIQSKNTTSWGYLVGQTTPVMDEEKLIFWVDDLSVLFPLSVPFKYSPRATLVSSHPIFIYFPLH